MTKKRAWLLIAVVFLAAVFFVSHPSLFPAQTVAKDEVPAKLVEEIARITMLKTKPLIFNPGSDQEGVFYELKFYTKYDIYVIKVYNYHNGQKALSISYYRTMLDFDSLKTPADLISREFIYGKPGIIFEEHLYVPNRVDGKNDMFQQFMKKSGSAYMEFSREDRDLGEKAGVSEYLLDGGSVHEKSGWRKATADEVKEIEKNYLERLKIILKNLKK